MAIRPELIPVSEATAPPTEYIGLIICIENKPSKTSNQMGFIDVITDGINVFRFIFSENVQGK